jgi:hypothetical protein
VVVINFSYKIENFEHYCDSKKWDTNINIIDLAITISREKYVNTFYPSDFDCNNDLHKMALGDYEKEMGLLSRVKCITEPNNNIRSVQFNDLPLYWLTSVSEKHPQNCVLKNIYYFKFLFQKLNLEGKEIHIILPDNGLHFQDVLKEFILKQNIENGSVRFNKPFINLYTFSTYLRYLKNFHGKIGEIRKVIPKVNKSDEVIQHLVFTYYPQTWKGEEIGDYVLNGIEKLAINKGKTCKYIPYFFDYKEFFNFKLSPKFDMNYFACFPSRLQELWLIKELVFLFKEISKTEYDFSNITFVNQIALKQELNKVIHDKMEFLFNYIWLNNYFSTFNSKVNVYYQDEFYPPGRIISKAAKHKANKNIKTIGVQHGLFYEAHTVYAITDNELDSISKNDGLPIPDQFVVWGNYFKDLFLSNNSLSRTYVDAAGNLNYIDKFSHNQFNINNSSDSKIYLLWCTSLKVDAINTYKRILKPFLEENNDVGIKVRCHPQIDLKKYMTEELINADLLERFKFPIHSNILDAITGTDIVLTVSGSTVFLDALVANKPVFHIVNNDYYMGSLGRDEMTHIENYRDLNTAVKKFKLNRENLPTPSYLLTLNSLDWENIIEKN